MVIIVDVSAKKYIWNPNTCTSEIVVYLKSIDDDSKIICDEIIDVINTIPINSDNKNVKYKMSFCVFSIQFY